MPASVEPVSFRSRAGLQLFGMLHLPDGPGHDLAVVLLCPGIKSRVAPHRLYVKWAAHLAEQGYPVLRFDFHGLGDSEGTIAEPVMLDLYGSVQRGRFVDDTLSAIDFLEAEGVAPRVILGGLCGAAITAVLAAHQDPRAAGILALALPVMLQGSNVDYTSNVTTGELNTLRGLYVRKLVDWKSWARFFSLKTDYRLLAKSFVAQFRRRKAVAAAVARPAARTAVAAPPPPPPKSAPAPAPDPDAGTNANPLFPPAFESLLARGCQVAAFFGESDRLYWEFEEKYASSHRGVLERHVDRFTLEILQGANHLVTFPEWQSDLFARTDAWLRGAFAALPASRELAGAGIKASR
jgi:pimeloyl-ACP methyl ester carboxylesterase